MILTYKDLLKENIKVDIFSDFIPKIIYRTGKWELNDLPKDILFLFNETIKLNPSYKFFYFSDNDCVRFIKKFFPDYLIIYNNLIPTAYKADIFRYLILFKYGGCYGDVTQRLFISYDELCQNYDRVLCRDSITNKLGIYNAIMCTKPMDSVVGKVLEMSKNNILNKNYGNCPLHITGPMTLGEAYIDVYGHEVLHFNTITLNDVRNTLMLNHIRNLDVVNNNNLKLILKTRIENHKELLYDKNNIHYSDLWEQKKVFKN